MHESDSSEQREAEQHALQALSVRLGVPLAPARLDLEQGAHVKVDGFHAGPPVVAVEIFAHQGKLKGGQKHKILADAVKLAAVKKKHVDAKLYIVLTDAEAAAGVAGGWRRVALAQMGIQVEVVPLPDDVRARVAAAQIRQRR